MHADYFKQELKVHITYNLILMFVDNLVVGNYIRNHCNCNLYFSEELLTLLTTAERNKPNDFNIEKYIKTTLNKQQYKIKHIVL